MRILVSALLLAASTGYAQLQESLPGLIVIEPELAEPAINWSVESEFPGASGQYVRYVGPNRFSSPDNNTGLTFSFFVQEGGEYLFDIRSLKNGSAVDAENDSWVSVNNGRWTKLFTGGFVGQWTWDTRYEFNSSSFQDQPTALLNEGLNTLEIRGRSTNHRIDRIVFSDSRFTGNPEDLSLPVSVEDNDVPYFVEIDLSNPEERAKFSPKTLDRFDAIPAQFPEFQGGLLITTPEFVTTGTLYYGSYERTFDIEYEELDSLELAFELEAEDAEVRLRVNDENFKYSTIITLVSPEPDIYRLYFQPIYSGKKLTVSFDFIFDAKDSHDSALALLRGLEIQRF